MLGSDPGLVAARAHSGESAVLLAVYHGEEDIARLLVQAGARTDIHEAAVLGLTDRVCSCLAAGPDQGNAYSFDGWTALHLAAFFGRRETAKALLDAGAAIDALAHNRRANMPLHAATAGRRVDLVDLLLEHDADVNSTTAEGWTQLHLAAHGGYLELVELLLARGASIGSRTAEGKTPLDLAMQQGQAAVGVRLRALGAA
jgi:uncharacterized protein